MNNSSFSHWLKGCVYLFIPFLLVYLTVMAVCFGYFFFSPNIVGWSLHNTLDASNCIEVLKNAIAKYGVPEIINSDQGRQFTCLDWKEACREHPEMKHPIKQLIHPPRAPKGPVSCTRRGKSPVICGNIRIFTSRKQFYELHRQHIPI